MNILFLLSKHSINTKDSTLTKDLVNEFLKKGHNTFVVTILEKKENKKTTYELENGSMVLRSKTGNMFNDIGFIEKGITTLRMPFDLKKNINKYLSNEKIDLIISHTPFMSDPFLINFLKKKYNCPAFLILWDIFPQNSKDLGLMKNKLLFKFFRRKEKKTYNLFDVIGCMSNGNINYLLEHNLKIVNKKLVLLMNWGNTKEINNLDKKEIRKKYGFKEEFIAIFGGNMGIPQKLENVIKLARIYQDRKDIKFLFVGNGTEKNKIKKLAKDLNNTIFIDYIQREDYDKLVGCCDLGLVSLDERFTVPNFPSKTLDYFKMSIPVLASLDNISIKDYGMVLTDKAKAGLVANAGDIEEYKRKFEVLLNNSELRKELGTNGRKFYENNLSSNKAYNIIINSITSNDT
jgi:glycosyltransferase involved in cell wall biosynthesis